jgi:hypothetical protein
VALAVGDLDELWGMSASAHGIALWGERTTAEGEAEAGLLWSRPAGSEGTFTITAGEVFGRMDDGERETVRGAAVTSRGTVVVGCRASSGQSSKTAVALVDRAGNARQTSPRDLVGGTTEPTGLNAVVQAGEGNIAVLGSPDDGKPGVPGAWHSRDGRTWTRSSVRLPSGVKQADFTHARQSGNRLYAVLAPESPATASVRLYASGDGGKTWKAAAALGAKDTPESLGVTALAAQGTEVAVAAGRGDHLGKGTVELLHSSDAGRTFGTLELPNGALLRPHAVVRDLALLDGALVASGMSGDLMDRHPFSVRIELPTSAAPSSGGQ